MPTEPSIKRTIAFIDGQNLFHAAKEAFGYGYPNFDVHALSAALCASQGWQLVQVRFYTGYPDAADNAFWNHFWTSKLAQMGRDKVHIYSRKLRYRNEIVHLPVGGTHSFLVGQEKGIDVRLALDILSLAHRKAYDVALVMSQDQDLSEVADDLRVLAREQVRWLKMACAFPSSPTSRNSRGINNTDWIKIDRATYDRCLDPRDYRSKPNRGSARS
jgi:uncharacterized LabA/DUF88 family protein